MRRLLKLIEHKHTAKRMPHRHTSYRGLWLVLALAGLSLFSIHESVRAAEYVVTATVPVPIPAVAAAIDTPANNSLVHVASITISGSCPITSPAIIVGIYNAADELLGSSSCSVSGRFAVNVALANGTNVLTPKVFTVLHDAGAVGVAVTITYSPTVVTTAGLHFVLNSPFLTYKINEQFDWQFSIQGGSSPYILSVDWGDGSKDTQSATAAGAVAFQHRYTQSGTHLIYLTITDNENRQVTTSVAAITLMSTNSVLNSNPEVNGSSQDAASPSSSLTISKAVVISYSGTVIVVGAFWFGAYRQNKSLLMIGKRRTKK
jgi:hypothetical protein